jgi:geranylgeranyl pyrophosphate synthase
MESYYLHGGTRPEVALGAARVIELIQAYLLIMDDVADNSMIRRGGLAVHAQLAKGHEEQHLKGDSIHYGLSQATNAAMLAAHRAMGELAKLSVPDAAKVRAFELLNEDISITVVGQINDIYNEVAQERITQDEIIHTLTWKTAYYTFVSPLELGACLAGADGLNSRLREYALKAGAAFQISDDVLGTFGDSFEVGKSADDDIREGKATLLVAHARRHATAEQRIAMDGILGQAGATKADCDTVRMIFVETGARRYAEQIAQVYAAEAEAALGDTPEPFLVDLVRFAVSRTS